MTTLQGSRLALARRRRKMTAKALAEKAGVAPYTITRLEKGRHEPEPETITALATALNYPVAFFSLDEPETLEVGTVSFRSLKSMTARVRDAAITGGQIGLDLNDWMEEKFTFPSVDLIDLGQGLSPEIAAAELRRHWAIGQRPIGHMIGLLESKGIRVYSLSEEVKSVNAFSFWKGETPFIFLNLFKTPESSIFDCAHELGHLAMHRHAGRKSSPNAEREADAFASEFLMPREDVLSRVPRSANLELVLKAKLRWRVSAMAMAYRLHKLGRLTDWQYRTMCINLTKRGYRTSEPNGIERESSIIWPKVFRSLWREKITKSDIAEALAIPFDELESLFWKLSENEMKNEKANLGIRLVE